MSNGIHRDDRPNAVRAFEDVDAGVALLELPKMFKVDAQDAADDSHVNEAVRPDENCFAGIFCDGVFQGVAPAILQVTKIFAVRESREPRSFIPNFGYLRKFFHLLFGSKPRPIAVINFLEPLVGVSNRLALHFGHGLRRHVSAFERAGDEQRRLDNFLSSSPKVLPD